MNMFRKMSLYVCTLMMLPGVLLARDPVEKFNSLGDYLMKFGKPASIVGISASIIWFLVKRDEGCKIALFEKCMAAALLSCVPALVTYLLS